MIPAANPLFPSVISIGRAGWWNAIVELAGVERILQNARAKTREDLCKMAREGSKPGWLAVWQTWWIWSCKNGIHSRNEGERWGMGPYVKSPAKTTLLVIVIMMSWNLYIWIWNNPVLTYTQLRLSKEWEPFVGHWAVLGGVEYRWHWLQAARHFPLRGSHGESWGCDHLKMEV